MKLSKYSRLRAAGVGLAAISTLALLSACASVAPSSGSSAGFKPAAQDDKAGITVVVDPTREAAVQAYQKAHPNVKVTVTTFDGGLLRTKMSLYDKSGSGWPDVVFSSSSQDPTWASKSSGSGAQPYAAPLNQHLIPQSTLDGWADGSLAPCQFKGNVYCLRNDIAQTVTWYNKTLFDQWGYTVPKTWDDFQALGLKVAKEHPGYLVGEFGDPWGPDIYFQASKCPVQGTTDTADTIKVNLQAPECTRMAKVIDTLLDAGVMGKQSYFEKGLDGSKVLMAVGPSWFGQYLFNATYKAPAGQIGVADQPQWDASAPANGNVGGGVWMVSSHSKNLKAATDLATWVTSNIGFQKTAPTYPANKAAAAAWLTNPDNVSYFATDVKAPFKKAAGQVWKGWANTTFGDAAAFQKVVLPGINGGKSLTSLLPAWQTEIVNSAKAAGYKVVQ
jgi:ABC-type glycerol-3-phosphate transport system substrate-binding protein